ncbi:MAG: serine hydrolase domain-containing protein, partial [Gemmatimonadaceae bacterium]
MHSIGKLILAIALLATNAGCASSTLQQAEQERYPHSGEPIGTVRQIYDGVLTPEMAANTFRNIDRLFPVRTVPRSDRPMPLPPAFTPLTHVRFTDGGKNYDLDAYLELNRVAGLLVLHGGRVKLETYRLGNTERTRWMSMSIAKSITSTLIGAALKDGHISSLDDPVTRYVPALAGSGYDGATVRNILMMASGVKWSETYTDPASDRRRLLEAQISQVPGSLMGVMKALPRIAEPGAANKYNTGETQVAAEILRSAVGRPLATYLYDRIWSRFGMEADANWWLDSPDGVEIGGSGFSATLRDYGRFGLFVLNGGIAGGEAILPDGWIAEATTPKVLSGGKPLDYGYLWWTGYTPPAGRDRVFVAEGIHGQFVYVNPVANVVIVVLSALPRPTGGGVIDDYVFFDAVAHALDQAAPAVIPERAAEAMSGSAFIEAVAGLSHDERESAIARELLSGNIPRFLRTLRRVDASGIDRDGVQRTISYDVMPDYLAIGSDEDFVRMPMSPHTAQVFCDAFGFRLPTRRMVTDIWHAAAVKLEPRPLTEARESPLTFLEHHKIINRQLDDFGPNVFVAGIKKDLVVAGRLRERPARVAIFGWHRTNGEPIQPLYAGHADRYVDYSHGVRPVRRVMVVDGLRGLSFEH